MKKVNKKVFILGFIALFTGFTLLPVSGSGPASIDEQFLLALTSFKDMVARLQEVRDYRCVLIKQEWLKNRMDREEMVMLFRKPMDIKLTWISPNKGQQALYRQGKNNDRLRARRAGLLSLFTFEMGIYDKRAMEHSRYPITHAGIGTILDKTMEDINRGKCTLRVLGEVRLENHTCIHLEFRSLGPRDYHQSCRSEFWMEKQSRLLLQLKMTDYEQRLIGSYTFSQLEVDVGLSDKDFEL